jgi:hypothetical protein
MPGENENTNENTNENENKPDPTQWRTDLGDLGNHERVKSFATVKDLAQAHADIVEHKGRTLPENVEGYKLPEGIKIKGLRTMAHANKFSQENLDSILKFNGEASKAMMDSHNTATKERADKLKETWGESFDGNVSLAKRAIKHFDPDGDMTKYLETTKAGDDARVISFMHKIGSLLNEDGYLKSEDNTQGDKKSLAERMFPNHKP